MAKQDSGGSAGPLAGEPRQRRPPGAGPVPRRRRVATWLTWWILLTGLWAAVDDSVALSELLVGAGAASLAAAVAELVFHQAAVGFQVRAAWLVRALRLPGEVARDTAVVFAALARALFTKAPPPSGGFRELPVRFGDNSALGVTRRVLLTGGRSLAPNEFVLGIDAERDVMIVHQLVARP
jgi:multisubunit Na+/H+ antiporter MnhE subunit